MASNAGVIFVVGRDYQAVLIAPNGTRMDLTNMTDFDVKPQYKRATCDPLNQPPARRSLPAGHMITFNLDRRDGTNDAVFLAIEQAWWNSGSASGGTGSTGSLTVTITEVGGGTTVQQYTGLDISLSNSGNIRQDSAVKQTIECFASQRVA